MDGETANTGAKILFEYGALGVLVALFAGLLIWKEWYGTKHTNKVLQELAVSNQLVAKTVSSLEVAINSIKQSSDNTSSVLNIVNSSLLTINQTFERHDKRCEFMNNDIKEICQRLRLKSTLNPKVRKPNYAED